MLDDTDATHTDSFEPVGQVARARASVARARAGFARIALFAAVGLLAVVLVAFGVLALLDGSYLKSGRIGRNVTIQGVAVAGMTADEARTAVDTGWVSTLPAEIKVTFPSGTGDAVEEWTSTPEAMGATMALDEAIEEALRVGRQGGLPARIATRVGLLRAGTDVTVRRHVEDVALRDALAELSEVVNRDPVDAKISVAGEKVTIVPGKVGRALDLEGTALQLTRLLEDPTVTTAEAVVQTNQPNVTAEDLAHIEVVLGQFTTKFRSHQKDRTHNLRLAAAALNETVIKPGQVLSLNARIGERLEARGYRAAPIFLEGEVTPSTGGGVCQIASTTYNAALLANLDIVERHHHSRPVDYVPTGQDATVYWGQYDLKIKNNLRHAILLLTSVGESSLTMKFLGSKEDDYEVEITRSGLTRIGYSTKETPDPELEEGKRKVEKDGRSGWRVTVHRKVTRDGRLVREQKLHDDYYAPQTEIVRVGTKKPEEPEEPTPAPTPAAPTPPTSPPPTIAPAPGAGRDIE